MTTFGNKELDWSQQTYNSSTSPGVEPNRRLSSLVIGGSASARFLRRDNAVDTHVNNKKENKELDNIFVDFFFFPYMWNQEDLERAIAGLVESSGYLLDLQHANTITIVDAVGFSWRLC